MAFLLESLPVVIPADCELRASAVQHHLKVDRARECPTCSPCRTAMTPRHAYTAGRLPEHRSGCESHSLSSTFRPAPSRVIRIRLRHALHRWSERSQARTCSPPARTVQARDRHVFAGRRRAARQTNRKGMPAFRCPSVQRLSRRCQSARPNASMTRLPRPRVRACSDFGRCFRRSVGRVHNCSLRPRTTRAVTTLSRGKTVSVARGRPRGIMVQHRMALSSFCNTCDRFHSTTGCLVVSRRHAVWLGSVHVNCLT